MILGNCLTLVIYWDFCSKEPTRAQRSAFPRRQIHTERIWTGSSCSSFCRIRLTDGTSNRHAHLIRYNWFLTFIAAIIWCSRGVHFGRLYVHIFSRRLYCPLSPDAFPFHLLESCRRTICDYYIRSGTVSINTHLLRRGIKISSCC